MFFCPYIFFFFNVRENCHFRHSAPILNRAVFPKENSSVGFKDSWSED